jgi:hypothetical protein
MPAGFMPQSMQPAQQQQQAGSMTSTSGMYSFPPPPGMDSSSVNGGSANFPGMANMPSGSNMSPSMAAMNAAMQAQSGAGRSFLVR